MNLFYLFFLYNFIIYRRVLRFPRIFTLIFLFLLYSTFHKNYHAIRDTLIIQCARMYFIGVIYDLIAKFLIYLFIIVLEILELNEGEYFAFFRKFI